MTKSPSPRPLSVKVMAIMNVLSGLFSVLSLPAVLTLGAGTTIFGGFIYGWPAFFYNLVFVVLVPITLVIGLWRLKELARRVSLIYVVYGVVNTLLFSLNPARRSEFIEQMAHANLPPTVITVSILGGCLLSVLISGLFLWFLIKRKSAFGK